MKMAISITTNGKKKISTFKKEFSSKFPYLTIQFLDPKRKEFDNDLNLLSIRSKKGDDISISGQNKINSLESKFDKTLGIAIEVCYSKNGKLIRTKSNNDKTLTELNKWCESNNCDKLINDNKTFPMAKISNKEVNPKIGDLRAKYLETLKTLQNCEEDFTNYFPLKEINHSMTDCNLIANLSFSTTPQSDEVIITIKTNAGAYLNFSFEKDMARDLASDIMLSVETDDYTDKISDDNTDYKSDVPAKEDDRTLEDIIAQLEANLFGGPSEVKKGKKKNK